MKLKPKSPPLPENVFTLNEDSLPTLSDADPWMKNYGMEKRCWLVYHSTF